MKNSRTRSTKRKEYSTSVMIHMNSQSKPIEYNNVVNSYTKDNMYCVYTSEGMIYKYPACNIFRVIETY